MSTVTAASWFGEALLLAGQVIALVVIVFVLCVGAFFVLLALVRTTNQAMRQALEVARETVHEQRGTGVPALFTFIGAASAAMANLVLTPGFGALMAIAVALATFVGACLAEDRKRTRAARGVGIAGCILPFFVLTLACFTSGNFSDLTPEEQVLVLGGLALGWVGVLSALASLADRARSQIAS